MKLYYLISQFFRCSTYDESWVIL